MDISEAINIRDVSGSRELDLGLPSERRYTYRLVESNTNTIGKTWSEMQVKKQKEIMMKYKIIFLPKYMYVPSNTKTNTKHNGGKIHNDNFTSGNMSCVPLFNVLQETSRLLKKMILITIRTMMLIE